METLTTRLQIEKYIIGAVVISNRITDAQILLPKHFSDDIHRKIWEKIMLMYPTKVINIATVANEFDNDFEILQYLSKLTSMVASDLHITQHSLILLQIFAKEKFVILINQLLDSNLDIHQKGVLNEISTELKENIDIFDAIDATYNIFQKKEFPQFAVNKVYAFKTNFHNGIKEYKTRSLKLTLFSHVERLVWDNEEDLKIVRKLKEKYASN